MDKEELIAFLKENLSVQVNLNDNGSYIKVEVSLFIGKYEDREMISSNYDIVYLSKT